MNQLDTYYRALLEYKQLVEDNRDAAALCALISETDILKEKIISKRSVCTVDEDWIVAIEEGLVHVEKALKEERQFIRSNGEVIPIEKVKQVSTESVRHLARHANLITRIPEDGEDIVPDQLYTVERLNDYTVYENRFLYMLLSYLRDFITLRYEKILAVTNRYDGSLEIEKNVIAAKRRISYTVTLKEERKDDKYLREHNSSRHVIERISLVLKAVLSYLSTPLMDYCAKVPMIKPPITKTNVLRMNNNFKGAVRLYEYIIAYDKPGYTVEDKITELSPFREDLAAELSHVAALASFITYEHGLGIKSELHERYLREEKRRKTEELLQKSAQLEALGKRVRASGTGYEEYALALEKQVVALTAECKKIEPLRERVLELEEIEKSLTARVEELVAECETLKQEIIDMARRHAEEIAAMKEAHEREIRELHEKYQNEIRELHEHYQSEIRELHEKYQTELRELRESYEEKIAELMRAHSEEIQSINEDHERKTEALIRSHEERIAAEQRRHTEAVKTMENKHAESLAALQSELDARVLEAKRRISEANATAEKKSEELASALAEIEKQDSMRALAEARVKVLELKNGRPEGDFTSRESFDELEREFKAFSRFYKEEWAKAKRKIRKSLLNIENFKKKPEESPQIPKIQDIEEQKDEPFGTASPTVKVTTLVSTEESDDKGKNAANESASVTGSATDRTNDTDTKDT